MTTPLGHRPSTVCTPQPRRRLGVGWRRPSLLAPTLALLAALLVAGPALSALRLGTPNVDSLIGTADADLITGDGGNDGLKGLAGNDEYFFADNWGTDKLYETATEGTDTLNFQGVTSGPVNVGLVREWTAAGYPYATGAGGSIRFFTTSGYAYIENVILGHGSGDVGVGGTGPNVVQPGGGATDDVRDYGGYNDGTGGFPNLPVSNDTFKGFEDNTGTDLVLDWGGTGDVVDLRPFATSKVYLSRRDLDTNGTQESLQIVTSPTTQVVLVGHYGDYAGFTANFGQQGRFETMIFANVTVTTATGLSTAVAAAEARTEERATLAEAADRLAEEARVLLAAMPEPGTAPGNPDDGGEAGPGAGPGPDASQPTADTGKQHDKKDKKAKKGKHDKKPGKHTKKHGQQDKPGQKHDQRGKKHDTKGKPGKRQGR